MINPGTIAVSGTDGHVLLRNRGAIWQVDRIGTLGDGTPGGTDFEKLGYSWSGPHPLGTADICSMF